MTWIQTHSGSRFDFEALARGEDVTIMMSDILHALSLQCRFAGHTTRHYSIAEHTCLVATLCRDIHGWGPSHDGTKLALLHDAHEAYTVDIPRPIKRLSGLSALGGWEVLAADAVRRRFGVAPLAELMNLVDEADNMALAIERRDVLAHQVPGWEWLPEPPARWRNPDIVPKIFPRPEVAVLGEASLSPPPDMARQHLEAMVIEAGLAC